MTNDSPRRALMIVDAQNDFIDGSLAVDRAPEAMEALARFVRSNPGAYALRIVTRDFHPASHSSFADAGGPWPRHCVASTHGAMISSAVVDALQATGGTTLIVDKATMADREEYSALANATSRKAILAMVEALGINAIDVCGIAGDICVANTLTDLRTLLPEVEIAVLTSFSPSVDDGTTLRNLIKRLNLCTR